MVTPHKHGNFIGFDPYPCLITGPSCLTTSYVLGLEPPAVVGQDPLLQAGLVQVRFLIHLAPSCPEVHPDVSDSDSYSDSYSDIYNNTHYSLSITIVIVTLY